MTLLRSLRKPLDEQNLIRYKNARKQPWSEATKHYRNKSDVWTDQRNYAKRDLKDLVTLAKALPQDKIDEVFDIAIIEELVRALLESEGKNNLKLAGVFASIGVNYCAMSYYEPIEAIRTKIFTDLISIGLICEGIAKRNTSP